MDKTTFDIPRLSNPPVMLSYLRIAYTFCPAWGFCGEAAGDRVPRRANVCHSGLAGSTSLIQKDSPKQWVVGVSSLRTAETQRIAATLGWSDDRRERRWRLLHSGGAGLSQPDGCQSKKVNDSTMLAPPPPHVSSQTACQAVERGAWSRKEGCWEEKGGCRSVDFAWGVWTGNIYDNQHPGWHRWAGWRFSVSIRHPPLSHP